MTDAHASLSSGRENFLERSKRYVHGLFTTATPALASGAVTAVLFNPFDRALYVRVHFKREKFLDRRNFERPFQGFGNAAMYRTICSASYVFWQDSCRFWIDETLPELRKENAPLLNPTIIGLVAGIANGAMLNNLQAVKFTMWSQEGTDGFMRTALNMYRSGGLRVFFAGIWVTIARDATFGVVYEFIRNNTGLQRVAHRVHDDFLNIGTVEEHTKTLHTPHPKSQASVDRQGSQFLLNLAAAIVACIASSPLNYARTVIYGNIQHRSSLVDPIRRLVSESKSLLKNKGVLASWRHTNARLNIGWGSMRVGLGMAVGQQVFALVKDAMEA